MRESESDRKSAFVGTCSYGDGTSVTGLFEGQPPPRVVVRCRGVGVGMRTGRRQLASGVVLHGCFVI